MNLAVILVVVFVLAYVLIAMENKININKSSVALLLCCLMWSLLSLFSTSIDPSLDHARISSDLLGALGSTCEILVFLIGAMTIVDIIDTHGGFEVITKHHQAYHYPEEDPSAVAAGHHHFPDVLRAGQHDHDYSHGDAPAEDDYKL